MTTKAPRLHHPGLCRVIVQTVFSSIPFVGLAAEGVEPAHSPECDVFPGHRLSG